MDFSKVTTGLRDAVITIAGQETEKARAFVARIEADAPALLDAAAEAGIKGEDTATWASALDALVDASALTLLAELRVADAALADRVQGAALGALRVALAVALA